MTSNRAPSRDEVSPDDISAGGDVDRRRASRARGKRETDVQDLSRLKGATSAEAGGRNELAWLLVLDNLVYAGDAESRWLDHVGTRLARGATRQPQVRNRLTARSHNASSTARASSTERASL
jgi:hypothetical protein